jgi:hypothetical protein
MKLSLPPKIDALRRKERQDETQFTTKIDALRRKERQDETQFTTKIDALWRKERQDETQFTTKIDGFLTLRITLLSLTFLEQIDIVHHFNFIL